MAIITLSIYSASKTARDEFPDYDVTVRGAVSIARRLMDPLAELCPFTLIAFTGTRI